MLVSLAFLATSPAHACGGFFCNPVQPVVQEAERIVFAVDEVRGEVEMHVQVMYSGPADEFAWVLPVSGEPDVFVSNQALFDQLAVSAAPIFQLSREIEGRCLPDFSGTFVSADASFSAPSLQDGDYNGVSVASSGRVGPYETVVLEASSEEALLGYLQREGYDLPDELGAVLAPYVATGSHFVALKLAKNQDVGDITPLGLTYAGTKAAIPIQLTSIAAAEDMRVEAYVYAHERAVPTSYLHVTINEAAVDWWNQGMNYPDVITQAANEAGGQAFATDYYGLAEQVNPIIFGAYERQPFEQARNAQVFIDSLQAQRIPLNGQLAAVLADHVRFPDGADPVEFLQCPQCFSGWSSTPFDAAAATSDLEREILEPLEHIGLMLGRYEHVTRMTSSLSADEMTVDPVFELNPTMSGEDNFVDNWHRATEVFECGADKPQRQAKRRLQLADGRQIEIPSQRWFERKDTTEVAYITELERVNAQVIEQMDTSSEGEVILDLTGMLAELAEGHRVGCSHTTPAGGAGVLGLLAVLLGIRRRR